VHPAPLPRIELLGIYPTWQSVSAQLAVALVLVVGYALNLRRSAQQD
jgi:high-affinity iron transporter